MRKYFKYSGVILVVLMILSLNLNLLAMGRRDQVGRSGSEELEHPAWSPGRGEKGHPHRGHMRHKQEDRGPRGPRMGRGESAPRDWRKTAYKLNLTSEQINLLREFRDDEISVRRKLQDKERILIKEMRELIASDSIDSEKTDELIKKFADNHSKMMRLRIDSLIYFRNLLTTEQRELLKESQLF